MYVRTLDDVMAIKPRDLAYFLNNGAPHARSSAIINNYSMSSGWILDGK